MELIKKPKNRVWELQNPFFILSQYACAVTHAINGVRSTHPTCHVSDYR